MAYDGGTDSLSWSQEQDNNDDDSDYGVQRQRRPVESRSGFDSPDEAYDSGYSGEGRRKRKKGSRNQRERDIDRPDNDMTRKLRSRMESTEPGQSKERSEPPEDDPADLVVEAFQPVADLSPERHLTEDESNEQLDEIQGMWELASILDFLQLFKWPLRLRSHFNSIDLTDQLVHSPGYGLIAQIHMDLMLGISRAPNMTERNWPCYLATRLMKDAALRIDKSDIPFAPPAGREVAVYASLSAKQRVLALKALCDVRLDRDDIKWIIEEALRPAPRPPPVQDAKKGGKPVQQEYRPYTMKDLRRTPLGVDSSGWTYWYLDCSATTGVYLFREEPLPLPPTAISKPPPNTRSGKPPAPKKKKVDWTTYQLCPEPTSGIWECIAWSLEMLREQAEAFKKSKKKPEQNLALMLLDIIPGLEELEQETIRAQKRQEKIARGIAQGLILQDGAGLGRSLRTRKPVSYKHDDFDNTIKAAIRNANSKPVERPPPRHGSHADNGDAGARSIPQRSSRRLGGAGEHSSSNLMELPSRSRPQRSHQQPARFSDYVEDVLEEDQQEQPGSHPSSQMARRQRSRTPIGYAHGQAHGQYGDADDGECNNDKYDDDNRDPEPERDFDNTPEPEPEPRPQAAPYYPKFTLKQRLINPGGQYGAPSSDHRGSEPRGSSEEPASSLPHQHSPLPDLATTINSHSHSAAIAAHSNGAKELGAGLQHYGGHSPPHHAHNHHSHHPQLPGGSSPLLHAQQPQLSGARAHTAALAPGAFAGQAKGLGASQGRFDEGGDDDDDDDDDNDDGPAPDLPKPSASAVDPMVQF